MTDKAIEAAIDEVIRQEPTLLLLHRNITMKVCKIAIQAYEAAKWQPIGSAPHEELVLLGWHDKTLDEWACEVAMASFGKYTTAGSNRSYHGLATHFQHLPTPPKSEGLNP